MFWAIISFAESFSCEFQFWSQRVDGGRCSHIVIPFCQLQTSSQFLWSTFPQIRFLPGKTLTILYSAFNQQQLVLANGSGHCLGLHMIFIQKDKLLLKPDPCVEHLSSPLRYNEVETVSIFHLNKKLLSHLKSSWLFSLSWVSCLVKGTFGALMFRRGVERGDDYPFVPYSFNVATFF